MCNSALCNAAGNAGPGVLRTLTSHRLMERQIGRLPGPRKRSNPTFLNSILMIALVLVLLGSIGFVLVLANDVGRQIKENVRVSAFLKENVNEVEMLQLRKKLEAEPFVQGTEYISKEEAPAALRPQPRQRGSIGDPRRFQPASGLL